MAVKTEQDIQSAVAISRWLNEALDVAISSV